MDFAFGLWLVRFLILGEWILDLLTQVARKKASTSNHLSLKKGALIFFQQKRLRSPNQGLNKHHGGHVRGHKLGRLGKPAKTGANTMERRDNTHAGHQTALSCLPCVCVFFIGFHNLQNVPAGPASCTSPQTICTAKKLDKKKWLWQSKGPDKRN